jgi:biopolymer transport protein ExbD
MIAGQIQAQGSSLIRLPVSALGKKAEPGELRLELDRTNRLSLNGRALDLEELDVTLAADPAASDRISLRADKSLTAAQLDSLLQVFRKHGATKVTLISTEFGES